MKEVGEIFEYKGVKLKTVESSGCDGCYFKNFNDLFLCTNFICTIIRPDRKSVIHIQVTFKFGR